MKFTSTVALGVALALGAGTLAVPAIAQDKKAEQAAPARKFDISKEARKAIVDLQNAVGAKDDAAFQTALAAANATAKTNDDKYMIGVNQLRHGINLDNDANKIAGIEAMIGSGAATQAELPQLYANAGALHYNAKQYDRAAEAFSKQVELTPNDAEAILRLAELRAQQNQYPQAIQTIEQAIAAQTAAGQPVPEAWYKRGLKFAYESKQGPATSRLTRQLISAYPTPQNWRDGLVIYRDAAGLDKAAALDLMRLMRASKSLTGDRDWFELAEAANDAGLPGEAKAVLDDAAAAKAIDLNKAAFKDLHTLASSKVADDRKSLPGLEKEASAAATGRPALSIGDAYLGYGDYAKAATMYRAAIQKGSVDANVANTRLGIALALQGQKAEAESALKAVTGTRAELANLWMLWLNQRG